VNPTQVTINAATTFQNLSDAAMGQTFDGETLDLRCESGEPARCINLACLSDDMVSVLNTQFDFSEIHMGTTDASAVAQAMPDPPGPDDVRASLGTASCFILPQAPGGMREKTYCVGQMGMQLLDVWAKAREWHKDLDKRAFIDLRTRFVEVNLVLSSPFSDVETQVVCSFRFEFSREGRVVPAYSIQPVSRYGTRKLREMIWVLVSVLVLMVACEALGIALNGLGYVTNIWFMLTAVLQGVGWAVVSLVYIYDVTPNDAMLFSLGLKGQAAGTLTSFVLKLISRVQGIEQLGNLIAAGAAVVWIRILLFLTIFPSANTCLYSIIIMLKELVLFLSIIVCIQLAFATAFVVKFRVVSDQYSFLLNSYVSLFRVLFGDFDFGVYQNTALELMAPFWICVYGFVFLFVLLNVFIAILSKGFEEEWGLRNSQRKGLEALMYWRARPRTMPAQDAPIDTKLHRPMDPQGSNLARVVQQGIQAVQDIASEDPVSEVQVGKLSN